MQGIRDAIEVGRFNDFFEDTTAEWAKGDIAPLG
jgi:queuine tRNA-ribosyltransferase